MQGTPSANYAIKNINLKINAGEFVGIIGHTGSGKSTLISHFNGLLKPTQGTVKVDGVDIWENKDSLRQSRFKVGMCFQYPESQLFEETVAKDIAFGPKNMKLSDEEIDKRVKEAAAYVGLKEDMLDNSPFDLSGGEKRRAAIAGVMAMRPEVLVLDEPAAGLDPAGRREMIQMIENYRRSTGCTVIMVSHSMEDIAQIADRVIVINDGEIAMDGTVEEIYSRSEELLKMGLNVPEVTGIFINLKNMGFDVPSNIYTVEKGVEILKKMMKGGETLDQ